MANMVDMLDFGVIRSDYDRWFSIEPYAILYINKMQYEVMMSEVDKYKAIAEAEKRRRVAAETVMNVAVNIIAALAIKNPNQFDYPEVEKYKKIYSETINEYIKIIKEAGE